jgi:hypothetical protein
MLGSVDYCQKKNIDGNDFDHQPDVARPSSNGEAYARANRAISDALVTVMVYMMMKEECLPQI